MSLRSLPGKAADGGGSEGRPRKVMEQERIKHFLTWTSSLLANLNTAGQCYQEGKVIIHHTQLHTLITIILACLAI